MQPSVIFKDRHLFALEKPFGWTVLYGSGKRSKLQEWIESKNLLNVKNESNKDFLARSGIVHRLDKETSGILLCAKTVRVFEKLQDKFKTRNIKKEYYCLVFGSLPKEGKIEAPIKRVAGTNKYRVFPGGRPAKTIFTRKSLFEIKGQKYSFVKVRILTGRTHQIRVHFKYLGYPLVGDSIYGRKAEFSDRLFLHAFRLSFTHPITEEKLVLRSFLPKDLQDIIDKYEKKD